MAGSPHRNKIVPSKTVKEAWEKAPVGTSIINGFRVTRVAEKRRVKVTKSGTKKTKKKRELLVFAPHFTAPLKQIEPGTSFHIVAFPRPEHMQRFKESRASRDPQAPSTFNPDAIGTMVFELNHPYHPLYLTAAQAHTQTGEGSQVSRSLMDEYNHWWEHALEEAVNVSQEAGLPLHVHNNAFRRSDLPASKGKNRVHKLDDAIKRVAKKKGIIPTPAGLGIDITPPKQ